MNLQEKFNKFHAESPHIYESFKDIAFKVLSKAIIKEVKYLSFDMIGHIMRYESWSKPDREDYKVNNNWISYLGRTFLSDYPHYSKYFRTRKTETEKAEIECPAYLNYN